MPQVVFARRAFSRMAEVLAGEKVDGLLADFGVSSLQLDEAHRGFSFQAEATLTCGWIRAKGRRPNKW